MSYDPANDPELNDPNDIPSEPVTPAPTPSDAPSQTERMRVAIPTIITVGAIIVVVVFAAAFLITRRHK